MILQPAKAAEAVNTQLERFLPALTPMGVALGYFLPGVFINLRPFIPLLFGTMTLSGALRLKAAEFGHTIRSPRPIFAYLVAVRLIMPVIAMGVSSFFFKGDIDTITGFILLFSGPMAVSSFIWTTIYNGDKALGLTLILLETLMAPLVVPGTLSLLMGARVSLEMSSIAVLLIMMVVIPTCIGVTLNEISRGKIPLLVSPYVNPLSKICLMLVIAANTSSVASVIRFDNPIILKVTMVCIMLTSCSFILTRFTGIVVKCSYEKCTTLFFSGGLRNIASIATIAVAFFPEAVVLPILVSIVFQHTISAILAKLLMRKTPPGIGH